jgi:hypothetical protein
MTGWKLGDVSNWSVMYFGLLRNFLAVLAWRAGTDRLSLLRWWWRRERLLVLKVYNLTSHWFLLAEGWCWWPWTSNLSCHSPLGNLSLSLFFVPRSHRSEPWCKSFGFSGETRRLPCSLSENWSDRFPHPWLQRKWGVVEVLHWMLLSLPAATYLR